MPDDSRAKPHFAKLAKLIKANQKELQERWIEELESDSSPRMAASEVRAQSQEFLNLLAEQSEHSAFGNLSHPAWSRMRELLTSVSKSRGEHGFTPSETASFVFSFKRPLFSLLAKASESEPNEAVQLMRSATELLDQMGLFTTEIHQSSRENVIRRQQQELLELSTPVVKLWEGVLALPMIGTLDSARTQVVMESLLQKIVETGATMAVIDITGVPTVDTLVAQHLLKTVTAARLMGAECIISGIRPQIAQTIVHLGVDLGDVTTKSSLADAFLLALRRTGYVLQRTDRVPAEANPVLS